MTIEITIDERIFKPLAGLALAGLVLWGAMAIAVPGDAVPNDNFQAGTTISAAEMNANFAELRAQIQALDGADGIRTVELLNQNLPTGDTVVNVDCNADEFAISGGYVVIGDSQTSAWRSQNQGKRWHFFFNAPSASTVHVYAYCIPDPNQ